MHMATITKSSLTAAAALALVLMAVAVVPATASTLTTFEGPGCTGETENFWECGVCYNITLRGGYNFYKTSEPAIFFGASGCTGTLNEVVTEEKWHCTGITSESFVMPCTAAGRAEHIRKVTGA